MPDAKKMSLSMGEFWESSHISGGHSAYLENMYELYLENPDQLSSEWVVFFDNLEPKGINGNRVSHKQIVDEFKNLSRSANLSGNIPDARQSKVIRLIQSYRNRGHQKASLDPLGIMDRAEIEDLDLEFHGLSKEDLSDEFYTDTLLIGKEKATLKEIIESLKVIYCGNIGIEYNHIMDSYERKWFQKKFESKLGKYSFSTDDKLHIYERLNSAEGLAKYLAAKYPGMKRFGIDGAESLIPLVDAVIQNCGELGANQICFGMAHRGRLNLLVNVLGKLPSELFSAFDEDYEITGSNTGDVKYHLGASSDREFDGNSVHVSLTDNPSHLEAVNPVVLGQTRAKQFFHKDRERNKVIPILIHGDAAFAGQGVVAECFAMSGLPGHNTGGTIHIIVNNQIGFTTSPRFARSSPYPSDVAKMVEAPILHVNGDDPEAVVYATRIATEFRLKFNRDVVVDLICYRRFGHNEGDEPSFTQPLMYKKIRSHPSVYKIYGNKLVNENSITQELLNQNVKSFKDLLDEQYKSAKDYNPKIEWFEGTWSRYKPERGKDKRGITGYEENKLKLISDKINVIPEEKNIHKTISKIFNARKENIEKGTGIDWSSAEALAFGSLLEEGYPVRLVGQDSGRGTFSQRHSVLRNQLDNSRYVPLNNISDNQKHFEVVDSFLSELAVLGFEYGYSLVEPNTLTLWEAQFGDFANGAQVVIDQFIASGERKWNRASGIVMLLPHGYEGQGPEHSSARLERFLQLCSNDNMQVMNCATPANYFHALRRQMHRSFRKPLIIMTPKSLLRNKYCVSNLEDFNKNNTFHRVLWDHAIDPKSKGFIELKESSKIKKVILCSGKVYFDLLDAREKLKRDDVVMYRIEQLYPFPAKALVKELKPYAKNAQFFWCQEEPKNMGAWFSVRDYIQWTLDTLKANNNKISYIGRSPDATPATGYAKRHNSQQKEIINEVFN